jgi:hypothetical protein
MFDSPEHIDRAEVIIMTLAKLYVILDLSTDNCPICRKALTHESECPILLSWSFLNAEQQHQARTAIRALALSLGCDDSLTDPMTH